MYTGNCLCGGVCFQILDELEPIQVCHCSQCRKAQGTAFATNTPVKVTAFQLDSGAELLKSFEASPGKQRVFCSVCGSPIYSKKDALPDVFGPVWTVLYAVMGIAAWLVWRVGGFRAARTALTLFLVQLAVNALWSWLFFGWQLGGAAFADIALLWVLIVATLVAFWRVRPLAGVLLVPYLLWVSFAFALNYSVWQLNPQVLG